MERRAAASFCLDENTRLLEGVSLPPATAREVFDELDRILELSSADEDLFKAMVAVGNGLANEAAVLVNMLSPVRSGLPKRASRRRSVA